MGARIRDMAYALPHAVVTNDDLARDHPEWDMDRVVKRSGVLRRHVAAHEETALDLGRQACQKLFEAHPDLPSLVDTLIFCTESADYRIPPNACVLHGQLGLPESVGCFDVGLGCSGYVYCLGVANALIASGMAKHVLVVAGDTYSKLVHPDDRSARVLFGDGAAATWVCGHDGPGGIRDVAWCTAGEYHDRFIIPGGGCRAPQPDADTAPGHVQMDGMGILGFTGNRIPPHVLDVLKRNGLTVEQVDLFVFHQASRAVLDTLSRRLGIAPSQMCTNIADVGNTVSASVPIVLKAALDAGRVAPGDTLLLCGFGLGLSWASAVVEWV